VKSPVVPVASGKETPKSPSTPAPNGSGTSPSSDKAKRDKQKQKEKKERKDRERAEGKNEAKEKGASTPEDKPELAVTAPSPAPASAPSSAAAPEPKSGKATPEVPVTDAREEMKSPTTDSTGARTPTSKRPQRHPWTLFVKLTQQSTEAEVKSFFGGEAAGVTKVSYIANRGSPHHRARPFAYVEFGDAETMKAGLEKDGEVSRLNI